MKGRINQFVIKAGKSPRTATAIKINKGDSCILVFDNNNCVGIVWEHYESRVSEANGQAEIYFFDDYNNYYGKWHRMFLNGVRLEYERLKVRLDYENIFEYSGFIRG